MSRFPFPIFGRRFCSAGRFLLLLGALLAAPAGAAPAAAVALDDASAVVQHVRQSHPDLAAAAWQLERAAARVAAAGLRPPPELGASVSSAGALGDGSGREWQVSLAQQFPLTDRLRRAREVAAADLQAATAEVALARFEAAQAAVRRWRDAIAAQARIALLAEQQTLLSAWIAEERTAAERGEAPAWTAAALALDRQELFFAQTEAAEALATALADLREALGLSPHTAITLPPLAPAPALPAPADATAAPSPGLRLAEAAEAQAAAALALAQTDRRGDLTVAVAVEEERSYSPWQGHESERRLGLALSLPWPSRRALELQLRDPQATLRVAEAQSQRERVRRKHALATADAALARHHAAVGRLRDEALPLAEQTVRQLEVAVSAGELAPSEVWRARQRLLALRSQLLLATTALHHAHDAWLAAHGQPPFADF